MLLSPTIVFQVSKSSVLNVLPVVGLLNDGLELTYNSLC